MQRLMAGAAIALGLIAIGLFIVAGCDQGVDTNRTDRVTSGKEADDIPTPLPRVDGGPADEGGDIPPAPTPDEGAEGEKPNAGGDEGGDGSGGSGGGDWGGGGCSGGSGGCSY